MLDTALELMPQYFEGLMMTLKVFLFTIILSVPLGMIVSIGRTSRYKILKDITGVYVLIMRGTPLLLQLVFIFFGLPSININVDRFAAVLIAFVLNYGAYFAEIFRGGILSIEKGQYEGAEVLGLSHADTFLRIILPQALKKIVPPAANEVITLVKDTSLIYAVGFDELLKIGKIASNRLSSLVPLLFVGIIYLILIGILTKILSRIEKRYGYYE